MFILIKHTTLLPIAIFPIILLLVFYFFFSYQKLKVNQTKKLELLYIELQSEKKKSKTLKTTSNPIEEENKKIHIKLLKIRNEIMNIDFSLSEIFSS